MIRMRKKESFVVCLSNDGYAASLEPRKIYVALRDAVAERQGLLRVVDESGEDYLYSLERFAPLRLPRGLQNALAAAGYRPGRFVAKCTRKTTRRAGQPETRKNASA